MHWLTMLLWVVTIAFIAFSIFCSYEEGDLKIFFVMIFLGSFFIGVFGWGLIGTCYSVLSFTSKTEASIFQTPTTTIFLVDDNPVQTFTDVATYNRYKGVTNCSMYYDYQVNIYGSTNFSRHYRLSP